MKQSLSARVLAFVCACALCVPVFAAERTHTLSEQSEAALGAKVYDYEPIRTDPAGNIKADKEKSTEKIDGAIATIMGLDRAIRCGNDTGASVYDSRGLLFI